MPTAAEQAYNKALSGTEVKELLKQDFDKLIANDGSLTDYVAYGRLSWKITLVLQTGNAFMPETTSVSEGGEKFPMPDAVTEAYEVDHEVTSPNVERVH